jgi:co-chaperonin GroES (HSP10)
MKLLSDRVKIELLPEEDQFSKSGLYLAPNPNTGRRHNYNKGRVISVGQGRNVNGNIVTMSVKEGDIIIYPVGPYKEYNEDDPTKIYHIIYETDVYAVLEDD